MKPIPYAAIIVENSEGEVLLLLRENKSTPIFPKHWTLIGGKVEPGETPEMAGQRQLREETGMEAELSFWKRYERQHPLFTIDQHIFICRAENTRDLLVLGRDAQFFKPSEIPYLKIGYGFKELLQEYLLTAVDHRHVHYA
ncbi:MAG: NUDIX hydrolase [Chloroflexota bacterium]|nr:NUDIX hydrolase [Chloroflexota bacterium]